MTHSTALEMLTAELLGDVGKLHDSIAALPEHVKTHIDGSMTTISQGLQHEANKIQIALNQVAQQANLISTETLNTRITEQANAYCTELKARIHDAIPIRDMRKDVNELNKEIQLLNTLAHRQKPSIWPVLAIGVSSIMMSGGLGFLGMYYVQKHNIDHFRHLTLKQDQAFEEVLKIVPKNLDKKKYQDVYNQSLNN